MSASNDQFREHVTGTSFSLTLSRRMIDALSMMDQLGVAFIHTSTARSLADRGLCDWADRETYGGGQIIARFGLTEAGKAVIPLLKLAGLYVEMPTWDPPVDLPEPKVYLKPRVTPREFEP